MKKANKNLTNEKKSFKEKLVENKGKILIGAGVVLSGISLYFLGREFVIKGQLERELDELEHENKSLDDKKKSLERELFSKSSTLTLLNSELTSMNTDRLDKIENVLFQGGVLEQAEATIHRKKNRLVDKLARCANSQGNPDNDRIIEECKAGIKSFDEMLDGCDFIRFCHKDEAIEKLVEED